MQRKYYKVWLHLEEITTNEKGEDEDYLSLDDEILPMPLGVFKTKDVAIKAMNEHHDLYDA